MPKPKSKGTSTSSFGSPGRASHDSSSFYGSQLYHDLPPEQPVPYQESPIQENSLNRIFHASAETMEDLSDSSVHLMVTSPPYNVGKDYDQDLTLVQYIEFLNRVWEEVYRVLVPGGRACINIGGQTGYSSASGHRIIPRHCL